MLVLTWLTLTLTQLGVHSWSWVHIYFISFDFSKIYFAKLSNAQWAWSTNNNLPAEVHTQRQPSITLSKSNAHSRVILCSLESNTVPTHFTFTQYYYTVKIQCSPWVISIVFCILCWHFIDEHTYQIQCSGNTVLTRPLSHSMTKCQNSNVHSRGRKHSVLNTVSVLSLSHRDISQSNAMATEGLDNFRQCFDAFLWHPSCIDFC